MSLLAMTGPHVPIASSFEHLSAWSLWAAEFEALLWCTELGLIYKRGHEGQKGK